MKKANTIVASEYTGQFAQTKNPLLSLPNKPQTIAG